MVTHNSISATESESKRVGGVILGACSPNGVLTKCELLGTTPACRNHQMSARDRHRSMVKLNGEKYVRNVSQHFRWHFSV